MRTLIYAVRASSLNHSLINKPFYILIWFQARNVMCATVGTTVDRKQTQYVQYTKKGLDSAECFVARGSSRPDELVTLP